jgi:hypothetical protein
MIFMRRKVYHSAKMMPYRNNFLDNRNSCLYSGRTHQRAGWQVLLTLTSPYTADSYPVKKQESTMQNNTNTSTHGETPYAIVKLSPSDLETREPRDWAFLREWANNLGVSLEVLLHRILVAAVIGQLYVEKIPEI